VVVVIWRYKKAKETDSTACLIARGEPRNRSMVNESERHNFPQAAASCPNFSGELNSY
jgi:hypothetical protein